MLVKFDNKEKYKSTLQEISPYNFYNAYGTVTQETTSPDGKFVVNNTNGTITVKNIAGKEEPFIIPSLRMTRVTFSPDGQLLGLGLYNAEWNYGIYKIDKRSIAFQRRMLIRRTI